MKRLALLISFIFVVIHGYSSFKTEADPTSYKNQNFTNSNISDSLVLVALYNQCDGINWTKKNNWLTGRLDTWQGVTVENGRVVELDLGDDFTSVGLTGKLPIELSNLNYIRSLRLNNNKLTGLLPESWDTLLELTILNLASNRFTGSLPASWSSLVNLQQINLFNNQLSGTLPDSWSALVNLSYLMLTTNQLSGFLPDSWSALSKLFQLGLANNRLSGPLPLSWSRLSNLHELILPENKFSGELPDSWANLTNLTYLIINDNQLSGSLPKSWSALVKLNDLFISRNKLSGSLPDSWSNLASLNQLDLSGNLLTGTLPNSWSSLQNLYSLYLSNNQFNGIFPESWKALVDLQNLTLNDNQLSDLPKLSFFSKLDLLTVENNLMDFGDIEPNVGIPKRDYIYTPQGLIGKSDVINLNIGDEFKVSVIVGGTSNKYQWFKNGHIIPGANSAEYTNSSVSQSNAGAYTCQITNSVATQLTLISRPITLQVLNVAFNLNTDSLALVALYKQCNGPNWTRKENWLTGRLYTWQGVIVEYGRVTFLELRDPNNSVGLVGQLPLELSNLTAIRCLLLSNNQLSGNLPENWSAFENLESLMLDNNQFTGVLPDSWSTMRIIYHMDLSFNYLSGELPLSWSVLQNLEAMILSHNQFTGLLPENWSELIKLKLLMLGSNQLSGSLPKSWSAFAYLQALWLYDNQLTGKLPDEWKAFENMANLSLSNNKFSGNLPDSWSSMTNLIGLTLNSNLLSGSFPESWKTFLDLEVLTLNDNQFSVVPDLKNFKNLIDLSVQNNWLDFGDIEPNIGVPNINYNYSPQAPVGQKQTITKNIGEEFRISVTVGGQSNKYQWYKNGTLISGANGIEFIIPSVNINDAANYTCQITNTVATQLTLTSNPITLQVQNQAFSANAGLDQTVNEGTVVSLDGSLSYDPNGNPLTYKWTVPAGITLSSVSASKPTFIAPEIERDTTYTFSLVVNNGSLDSPADQVRITILNVNKAPIANAGMDQSVITGEMVSLDGSASTDPDGNQLIYKWTAPDGIILSSVSDSMPIFTAPEVTSDTIYTFSLIVNDGMIDSPADQVMITIIHADKQLLVNAGPDQYVYERNTVYLDGAASSVLNKKPLTYQWIGPADICLSSLIDAKPTFKAPDVTATNKFTFSLVVNDGITSSTIDRVNIYVLDEIRIYPNITTGIVNIEFNIGTNRETEVLLLNLLGTVLIRNKIINPSIFQLDLSKFADETYVIIINYDDKHYSNKIILRR